MVTILISAAFREAALIREGHLLEREAIISMWAPKSAALIRGQRLFEAWRFIEKIR